MESDNRDRKEYMRQWREENNEYQREWREKNKEKTKEYDKKYYEENKEKRSEKRKKYYEKNIERERKKSRERKRKQIEERSEETYIYCIHSFITNKKYIGCSVDIDNRISSHFLPSSWDRDMGKNIKLYKDMKLYGKESFIWGVIEKVENGENELEKESYWMKYYDTIANGYNTILSFITEEEKREYHRKYMREYRKGIKKRIYNNL
jgi:hypothetical protein